MKPTIKMKHHKKLIEKLATTPGPISPFDLTKTLKTSYSTMRETLQRLYKEGYVQLIEGESKKGGKKTFYALSFRGVLQYLAWFEAGPGVELDLEEDQKLIETLKRHGQRLNYVLFQEAPWLSEHFRRVTQNFIMSAQDVLFEYLSDPVYTDLEEYIYLSDKKHSKQDKQDRRDGLDDVLKVKFGSAVLAGLVFSAAKLPELENEKLKQFADHILAIEESKLMIIKKACKLFSKEPK